MNKKFVLFLLTGTISAGVWGISNWKGTRVIIEQESIRVEEQEERKEQEVIGKIKDLVATASGSYSIYVYDLETGESYGVNESEVMPGASIMKIPALVVVESRKDETWTLEEADRATGSGPLQFLKVGTSVTVERVMDELGKKSDNTAWRMINRRIGYEEIEKKIEEMGLVNTDYRELTTTVKDVGIMMRRIYEKPDLWQYLEESIYEDRITLGLPEGTRLVHKVGTDDDIWSDAGIVVVEKPFVLVILNKGVVREEAQRLVPEITRVVWEYEGGN